MTENATTFHRNLVFLLDFPYTCVSGLHDLRGGIYGRLKGDLGAQRHCLCRSEVAERGQAHYPTYDLTWAAVPIRRDNRRGPTLLRLNV